MTGWIKLHRKSYDNFLYKTSKPHTKREAWEDILVFVNHEESFCNIRGEQIKCKRGQSLMSQQAWGKIFNWDKDKVRRFFKILSKCNMIKLESTNRTTRLTVCNYAQYQKNHTTDLSEKNTPQNTPQNAPLNETETHRLNGYNKDVYKDTRTAVTTIPAPQNTPQNAHNIRSKEEKKLSHTWRESFDIYCLELKADYDKLILDQNFIKKHEKLNPECDILLSMEKAFENFWNTDAGWTNKKSKKDKTIDWKSTFAQSIGNNKVPKNKTPESNGHCKNEKRDRILN